ncbi:PREDICTED: polyribonucleotide nucleotidyltransferase 2, mitochondrial-like [Camelina sativa]|nr:PREDICTED: polyribonucleotide nucleotidyltransferase 2, mitochondrial-like [Camelina sativa]
MPSIVTPPQKSKLAVPAVVIRTAVECDEAEKSSPVDKNNKPKRAATPKPDRKPKSTASKLTASQKEKEALELCAPEEIIAECGETLKQDRKLKPASPKNNSTASIVSDSNLVSSSKAKKSTRKEDQYENKAEESATVSTRELKIGTEMMAKVQQVRPLGLVLDLGGGIRGMYKFEDNEETEFEEGDTLQVKCTSFTTKGIPEMVLVDEEED